MPGLDTAVLFFAASFGALLNSVAGGGSFITFPALVWVGIPSIAANATSTVVLWPASASSAWAYRDAIRMTREEALSLGVTSLVGGVLGSWLLMTTPESLFKKILPFLMLLATLLFWKGSVLNALLPKQIQHEGMPRLLPVALLQVLIAIYGGYFGGGMGLMMLAVLALSGQTDIHRMNGIKNVLAVLINLVAALTFMTAGKVVWHHAGLMVVGGILGGYAGAKGARKVSPQAIRVFVVAVGTSLSAIFFWKGYF